jgi:hypothetical protein
MKNRTFRLSLILILLQLAQFAPDGRATCVPSKSYETQTPHRARLAREENKGSRPLWTGARFNESDRRRATYRGMRFIYRTAREPQNFATYGSDYLWCFYTLSEAVKDPQLRRMARGMGKERAREWRRTHRALPKHAAADTVADFAFGSDAADSLGVRDERLKEEIRIAAAHIPASAFLKFDPHTEPPPTDVPDECEICHAANLRGNRICSRCQHPLKMRTRYDVWYDALITAYSGDRYGVKLGAHYTDVLKWLPSLRPYRGSENKTNPEFYDTVYAVTHVVYTLNHYSLYSLSPAWLPAEFEFLKTNMREAIAERDADMLGEFMDSLRAFGLSEDDTMMRDGVTYLLSHQNADGSWGDVKEKDVYLRYHPTWNSVAALSQYDWRGQRLSFPEALPLLRGWTQEQSRLQEVFLRGGEYEYFVEGR